MNSADQHQERLLPSDLLLLLLILAIPIMKPAVSGEIIAADLLFVALVLALLVEVLAGLRRVRWIPGYGALLAYFACLVPSLFATADLGTSAFKLATELYLVVLAAIGGWLIDSEAKFRRAVFAWLAATAIVVVNGTLSLLAFATGRATWLLSYSISSFGSLPPGPYVRLSLTFFNANMACNYLTASLAMALLARWLGYIGRAPYRLLLAGIAVASLSTLSPGLGGIALLAGLWLWSVQRHPRPRLAKAAVTIGVLIAGLFVVALAFTPVVHSTAPFSVHLPFGPTIYPSGRFLIWKAALTQFVTDPLVGIGIGIDPVHVRFAAPMGMQTLTDAHNVFLSIGAQCGIIGLIGLGAVLAFATGLMRRGGSEVTLLLGAAFLDVLAYQGLGGSFEDSRHIWLLLGFLIATSRLDFSRADGKNRTAGAPSPG
jgi:O-antigen ligase